MKDPEKPPIHFLRTTVIGGLLFLVPLSVLIIVLTKTMKFAQDFITPLTDRLPFESLIGLETPVLGAILFLILICFLFGLYARTPFAKNSVKKVESMILSKIPGYELLKGMSENLIGLEEGEGYPVVILNLDGVGQIALLIEDEDDNELVTVFVPDAPSPTSGGVFFVSREVLIKVETSVAEAMTCLTNFGTDSTMLRQLMSGAQASVAEGAS